MLIKLVHSVELKRSYQLTRMNRKNSQRQLMQYHKRIFHLIIILSISRSQTMLAAIVVLLTTARACAFDQAPPTDTHKYIWLNITSVESTLQYLSLPKAGNANYFTHLKNQVAQDSQYQIFIDLYHDYYVSSGSDLITCQTKNDQNYCQFVQSGSLSSLGEIHPDKIIGQLILESYQEKILQLLSGQRIEIIMRSAWKDYIQFTLVAASVLLVFIGLYLARIVRYLDQRFILQLTWSLCLFVREGIEYVRESIQNWSVSGWKFWLFIPLSILSYQILESFMQACLSRRITLKGFVISVVCNYFLYYVSGNMLLYAIYCRTDQSYQQSLPIFQKMAISQNSIQIMRILYTILHLKLVFVKEFSYFVTYNPIYFLAGSAALMTIWQADSLRLSKQRETKQRQDNKDKIKVFRSQADFFAEISLPTVSDALEQQCAICYQRIDSDWAMTACHHVFHSDCLKEWLQKSETCPIDRKRALNAEPGKEIAKKPAEDILI